MTPKELKRLSRRDLLEMLLELSKENEQLQAENEILKNRLESRRIEIENCGSIAQAALRLNGVFEAAQQACRQYIENIRLRSQELDSQLEEKDLTDIQQQVFEGGDNQ